MLDIKYVREHLDEVAETMKNRHASFSPEQFTALDVQRREVIAEEEALQAERNKLSKEIGALMGQGKTDEANATKETVRQINEKLTALGDARAEDVYKRQFAARAAAELEARQARRAQEAAAAQRSFGSTPARAAAASAHPAAAGRPAAGVPAQAQGFAPVQPAYGAPSGARARHAR